MVLWYFGTLSMALVLWNSVDGAMCTMLTGK